MIVDGKLEKGSFTFDLEHPALFLSTTNGLNASYKAQDLYECLGLLRADFPNIKFLCKGAKLNVHPSRMSSQMSAGLIAYELRMGKSTDDEDTVNIFDYEDTDITNEIKDQRKFYKCWIESLSK